MQFLKSSTFWGAQQQNWHEICMGEMVSNPGIDPVLRINSTDSQLGKLFAATIEFQRENF
jgi:hypothetical protein